MIHNRLNLLRWRWLPRGRILDWRLSQLSFDPSFGNLARLATLMSSDRTKQICLWMTIYIYIYIWCGWNTSLVLNCHSLGASEFKQVHLSEKNQYCFGFKFLSGTASYGHNMKWEQKGSPCSSTDSPFHYSLSTLTRSGSIVLGSHLCVK